MSNLRSIIHIAVLGTVGASTLAAGPVLHLTPGDNIAGIPGSTVGWGFTLNNDLNWIEVVQAQFCLDIPLGNPCFTPSSQFTDIISSPPNDVIVGPGGSSSMPYDPGSNQGLGSFAIDPGAADGSTVSGNILLTYNTFDNDPNAGGNQIGFNDAISSAASVTATSIPEPATFALAGFAIAGLGVWKRRRRLVSQS